MINQNGESENMAVNPIESMVNISCLMNLMMVVGGCWRW